MKLYNIFSEIEKQGLTGIKKKKKRKTPRKTKTQRVRRVSTHHTRAFHKNKHRIGGIILRTLDDGEIIYGEHSLHAHLPKYLERPTTDYDVYAKNPRKEAYETEKALDKKFGGDYFYVKQAQHPGTYKVVAHANQEGYADFTRKPRNVRYREINGYRYSTLQHEKENRQRALKDPDYSWRHGKDQDALNRIKIYEQNKKNRGR